jgi:hypothetical protein
MNAAEQKKERQGKEKSSFVDEDLRVSASDKLLTEVFLRGGSCQATSVHSFLALLAVLIYC